MDLQIKKLEAFYNKIKITNETTETIFDTQYHVLKKYQHMILHEFMHYILKNTTPITNIVFDKIEDLEIELYPYQINGINWMYNIEKNNYLNENEYKTRHKFYGGGLFDEMGMGKTLQIIGLIHKNPSKSLEIIKENKFYSKATLIIVPAHLCHQWLDEINKYSIKKLKIIVLITKIQFKKYTMYDYLNADIVIITTPYFKNCDLTPKKSIFKNISIENIFTEYVNVFDIYWHRIVIDEFHEYEQQEFFNNLYFFKSSFRWILSGTPLQVIKSDCYSINELSITKIFDFIMCQENVLNNFDLDNIEEFNYLTYHFSRNLYSNNTKILKFPEMRENIITLDFSENEKMLYNSFLVNLNGNENLFENIFLQQFCSFPNLTCNNSTNILSIDEVKNKINNMYLIEYEKCVKKSDVQENKINGIIEIIKKIKEKLEKYENQKEEEPNIKAIETLNGKINKKTEELKENEILLEEHKNTLTELNIQKNNAEKPVIYYRNFLNMIDTINNTTSENDCPICYDSIKNDNMCITMCCHIFCNECIKSIFKINNRDTIKCPHCSHLLKKTDICIINNYKEQEKTYKYGTKIDYLIEYIKQTPNKYRIIFSKWNTLLHTIGKFLLQENINILYCEGTAYSKNKTIKEFNNISENNSKIIMMSSTTETAGLNLKNAEEIIFMEPIYAEKTIRLNMEKQALGRVIRLGNINETVTITRLIIKDSIEEEIFKQNIN
jgi:SNF2 family DNA or RNA helicase